jgi:hypothetical protein
MKNSRRTQNQKKRQSKRKYQSSKQNGGNIESSRLAHHHNGKAHARTHFANDFAPERQHAGQPRKWVPQIRRPQDQFHKVEPRVYYVYFNYKLTDTAEWRKKKEEARKQKDFDHTAWVDYINSRPDVFLTIPLNPKTIAFISNKIIEDKEVIMDDHAQDLEYLQVHSCEQLSEPRNNKYFKLKLSITKDFSNEGEVEVNSICYNDEEFIQDFMWELVSTEDLYFGDDSYNIDLDKILDGHIIRHYDIVKEEHQIGGYRKQRGASAKLIHEYYVYYNYIISNFQNDGGINGQLLTRPLYNWELNICQENMEDTRDIIIEDGRPQYKHLNVGRVTQLPSPHNNKYFRINFTVINKSDEDARILIRGFMEELHGGVWIEDLDDQNRYYSTPGQDVDIEAKIE